MIDNRQIAIRKIHLHEFDVNIFLLRCAVFPSLFAILMLSSEGEGDELVLGLSGVMFFPQVCVQGFMLFRTMLLVLGLT